MPTPTRQFAALSRLLHWAMAAMVLTMLGIGMAMVVSLGDYHALLSIHRPLGIAILVLVVIRFVNRRLNPPPPFLASMSEAERRVATASELAMYGLMLVLPLVGWGMLSAARYPSCSTAPCISRSFFRRAPRYTRCCGRRTPSSCTSSSSRFSLTSPRSCSTRWSCGTES